MSATGQTAVTPERIMQIAWGYAPAIMLEAGVRNGIFDTLDEGYKTIDEVAAATGASPRGLRAVMNALAGLGVLVREDGKYGLSSDAAAFLVKGKPAYMGGLARHTCEDLIPKWLHLDEVVRAGRPTDAVNQQKKGAEFFHGFVEDIFPMSYPAAKSLANALNVAGAQKPVKVLDLAAGSGVWGIALAEESPRVSVAAVDWPDVLDVTRKIATRRGVADRFTFIGGDLASADFGGGYQIATLGHILHSEGETRSRQLLKKTHDALAPGGTIAIAEFLVNDDRSGPPMGLIFAVNMLVATDEGDTFSYEEISGWLVEAGFRNPRTLESPGPSPLILADRP